MSSSEGEDDRPASSVRRGRRSVGVGPAPDEAGPKVQVTTSGQDRARLEIEATVPWTVAIDVLRLLVEVPPTGAAPPPHGHLLGTSD